MLFQSFYHKIHNLLYVEHAFLLNTVEDCSQMYDIQLIAININNAYDLFASHALFYAFGDGKLLVTPALTKKGELVVPSQY